MKKIIYQLPHFENPVEGLLIESIKDVELIQEFNERNCERDLVNFVTTTSDKDFQPKSGAVKVMQTLNDPSLFEKYKLNYSNGIIKLLNKGYKIVINSVGGFCPVEDSEIKEVLEDISSIQEIDNRNLKISPKSERLVLENDPSIDNETIKYFKKQEEDYSYVINLRTVISDDNLSTYISKFKSEMKINKKPILFVYTTGSDIEQAYEYSNICINSGIKKFEFMFAVKSKENYKLIESLKERGCEVTLIKVENYEIVPQEDWKKYLDKEV